MARLALLLRLARRSVLRNRRRTLIILVAISVALWAMIFFAALTRGWENDVVHNAIFTLTGHLQVHAPGYRDDPSVDHSMKPPNATVAQLLAGTEVAAWGTRVRVPAVVMSEHDTAGVTLVGIDPAAERGLSFIADAVHTGRYLDSPDDRGILIGRALADRLGTGVGKRVVVMSQAADHSVADRGFRVVGLFEGDREATEMAYVFVGRRTAMTMLKLGSRVSELAVMLRDRRQLPAFLARLRTAASGLDVQPWTTLEPMAQAMVALGQAWIWMFFVVMYVAMAFGLVNTMLMAVMERTREFGMLQALGMRPRLILIQVVFESCFLLAAGAAAGIGLAAGTLSLLHGGINLSILAQGAEMWGMGKVIYPAAAVVDVIGATALVVVLGVFSSLYPAWRAARRVPIEAITRN
ncbi:MAG: FtsX-like permease family protein [Acidobacteria bacterium]|nr:FtsX-like permease family protein [Acidobacteriota bacterium]